MSFFIVIISGSCKDTSGRQNRKELIIKEKRDPR